MKAPQACRPPGNPFDRSRAHRTSPGLARHHSYVDVTVTYMVSTVTYMVSAPKTPLGPEEAEHPGRRSEHKLAGEYISHASNSQPGRNLDLEYRKRCPWRVAYYIPDK